MTKTVGRTKMGKKRASVRSFRVRDEDWEAAQARALEDGFTMSELISHFVWGYAERVIDAPQVQVVFTPSATPGETTDLEPAATEASHPGHREGIVPVVELPRKRARHADPAIFEYAMFRGERWDDVHNVKQLLGRLAKHFWHHDRQVVLTAKDASGMVTDREARKKNVHYLPLDEEHFLYAHWATHYLLAAAQELVTTAGLEDEVHVALSQAGRTQPSVRSHT